MTNNDLLDPRETSFDSLLGITYKFRWLDQDVGELFTYYVTINDLIVEGTRRPFELFMNSKDVRHYPWVTALTRMISGDFRRGRAKEVANELQQIFDPRGSQIVHDKKLKSLPAAVGFVIERHLARLAEDVSNAAEHEAETTFSK